MISHTHKSIFIHVPKTAGTSIEKELGFSGPRHNTALQYLTHFADIWGKYYSFAFVRNPWDRVLSLYLYRRQNLRREAEVSLTFTQWLARSAEYVRSGDNLALNRAFAPRYGVGTVVKDDLEGWRVKFDSTLHMLTDENGELIVDFVGRYERLQQDFDTVCARIGIEPRVLPILNRTEHRPYWTYYDEESERIVAELFHRDIVQFSYAFGKADQVAPVP